MQVGETTIYFPEDKSNCKGAGAALLTALERFFRTQGQNITAQYIMEVLVRFERKDAAVNEVFALIKMGLSRKNLLTSGVETELDNCRKTIINQGIL